MNDNTLLQVWVYWIECPWMSVKDISAKMRISKSKIRRAVETLGFLSNGGRR